MRTTESEFLEGYGCTSKQGLGQDNASDRKGLVGMKRPLSKIAALAWTDRNGRIADFQVGGACDSNPPIPAIESSARPPLYVVGVCASRIGTDQTKTLATAAKCDRSRPG